VVLLSESFCYCRLITQTPNRLDENFNHPRFDVIPTLLLKSKFSSIALKKILVGIDSGKTPKGIRYEEQGISFLGASNITDDGSIDLESAPKINVKDHNSTLKNSQIKRNDVLVSIAGTIGRCAVFDFENECNCNQALAILRINPDEIDPFFLAEYLNSKIGQLFFQKIQHISSQPNINLTELNDIEIIKPDLEEQKTILKKLKPFTEYIVALIEQENILFFQKETTFQKFIGIEDFQVKNFDYYTAERYGVSNRLDFNFNSPKYAVLKKVFEKSKFPFVELGLLVKFHYETIDPTKTPEKEYEYVDIGNIDTKLGKMKSIKMLGKEMTSSRMRRLVKTGYILASTTRPTRKAVAIVPDELDEQVCSTGFAVMECNEQITKEFLFSFLRTDIAKLEFEQFCSGSGYPAINQDIDLPKIKVPLPPTKEKQKEIINALKDIGDKIEKLELEIKQKIKEKADLFQKLIVS
jgi:restriction endonuclease S subunit